MDDLPEGDAWVATKTCTTVDHRNCERAKSNYLELLKKVISMDIEADEVFFQNGNCVLFTNEMAVPQKGFFEEATDAVMGRRRNDRQAFGGKTPRRNGTRGGGINRATVSNRSTDSSSDYVNEGPYIPRTVDATEIDDQSSSSPFLISLFILLLFIALAGILILIMMPKKKSFI
jgi:hypothetical protein